MPLMSKLIIQICLTSPNPTCVVDLHVCMRDVFEVNFWDELDRPAKAILPWQLVYCNTEQELDVGSEAE